VRVELICFQGGYPSSCLGSTTYNPSGNVFGETTTEYMGIDYIGVHGNACIVTGNLTDNIEVSVFTIAGALFAGVDIQGGGIISQDLRVKVWVKPM
jgi:hypothetical protein